MRRSLSLALAAAVCLAAAAPARAALSLEVLKGYVARAGARIDSSKGNLLVTSMPSGRARVEIRMLNDVQKHRLGMYAYGFGNIAAAPERDAVLEYLLRANSELGVGSFFVDKDNDIGYKTLLDTRDRLSFETFQIVYLAMVAAIAEHRPEIARLAGGGREKPAEEPSGEGAALPPGRSAGRRRA